MGRPTLLPLCTIVVATLLALTFRTLAAEPLPADAVDFILGAATQPTTKVAAPATAPTTPFTEKATTGARRATFTFSDGSTFSGWATTTLDKPLRIWVEERG